MADTSLQNHEVIADLTIVGGGPTGMFAAFYAGVRDLSVKIIDSLPQLGGQLSELYPEKYIYDVAGFPKILAKDLVANLREQALQFHPTVVLNEKVTELVRLEDGTFCLTTDHAVHLTKSVLLTAGIGAFTPRRLPAKGTDTFENGRGVQYYIDSLNRFQGKKVLVVGGGDSAVDFALMLVDVAEKVTLIHRRDQFRAHEDNVRKMYDSTVEVRTFAELKELDGTEHVERGLLLNSTDKTEEWVEFDEVIGALGFSAALGPILKWGLETEDNAILVNTKMETNIPGVYAAGDIVTYPGKIKLIATGFGEAPTAVNNVKRYLDPASKLHPGHSSSGFGKQH
jgi:ferredoxin/flavodoxin---NADP+ reductase